MTKHRVVSVGDKRAIERWHRIVQEAAFDIGLTSTQAHQLARAISKAALAEGLVLTWQVTP